MKFSFKLIIVFLLYTITLNLIKAESQLERQQIQSYQVCRNDGNCKPNSFCFGNDDNKTGKCKCMDGYDLQRNSTFYQCLKGVNVGDNCIENFQCKLLGGLSASCIKNICTCNNNTYLRNNKCVLKIELNSVCMNSYECDWIENSGCFNDRCTCKSGMKPSADNQRCLFNVTLGQPCHIDENCNNDRVRCVSKCICKPEFVISRDSVECLPAAKMFEESCIENAQCTQFLDESTCKDGKCVCIEGRQPYGSKCVEVVDVGQSCKIKAECNNEAGAKSVDCINGVCKEVNEKGNNGSAGWNKIETYVILFTLYVTYLHY